MPQSLQLVMSSSTVDPNCPTEQFVQIVEVDDAMNVPGEQHPKRAVLDPLLLNALKVPDKDSHLPPHNVRVKPLL